MKQISMPRERPRFLLNLSRYAHVYPILIYLFITVLLGLAYFSIVLSSMLYTTSSVTPHMLPFMVICSAIPSLCFAFKLAENPVRMDSTNAYLLLVCAESGQTFLHDLPIPLSIFVFGCLAFVFGQEPQWFWAGGTAFGLVGPPFLEGLLVGKNYAPETLRGRFFITQRQAYRHALMSAKRGEAIIDWCGIPLPERYTGGHFALIGATGSGKTIALRLHMQSVMPFIQEGNDSRALVYDAKGDMLSILAGFDLSCPVKILNPFDSRAVAWDMGKDITSPATALQAASILIKEETSHNAFFSKAARDLLAVTFIAFHLRQPGDWSLSDVVLTLSDTERTKRLLNSTPQTRHICREHFQRDSRTLANVQYTITANMSMLRPIAALWDGCTEKISLTDWVRGEFILVLGNDESLRSPLDALNRVIFQRLGELLLAQTESCTRRTWIYIDEAKEAGRLDILPTLLTKGRTKGTRNVLTWQTIEGLRAVYGDRLANELAGMCSNKALLRTDSPETAYWASQVIGDAELREWQRSFTFAFQGDSSTIGEHIVKRQAMLASEIMQLPLANRNRFYGYFVTPSLGTYKGVVQFGKYLRPHGNADNYIPRPTSEQYLSDNREPVDDMIDSSPSVLDEIGRVSRNDDYSSSGSFPDDDLFSENQQIR